MSKEDDDDEAHTDSTSSTGSSLSEHGVDDSDEDDDGLNVDTVIKDVSNVFEDMESGEPKEVYLPPLKSKSGETISRKIPNCCAVCLCSYDVGDTVVWSCNEVCQHAFHDECIVPWLVKNQSGECPCCRSPFTDLPSPDGKNNGSDSPSFWSFRSWMNRVRYTFVSQGE